MAIDENWLPVFGWEDLYRVSDLGNVCSLDRVVVCYNGVRKFLRGQLLTPTPNPPNMHLRVVLTRNQRDKSWLYVHNIVLEAFVGPRPHGLNGLHWDDDFSNNRLSNLRWGTQSENLFDCVRNGNNYWANRTHCEKCGSELKFSGGQRRCPNRYRHSSQYLRRVAVREDMNA